MLPGSKYVSPYKASISFYKKHSVAAEVTLQSFVALQPKKWLCGNYLKEVLNSTYVKVCLLVHEKHKGGTGFVLFSQCH